MRAPRSLLAVMACATAAAMAAETSRPAASDTMAQRMLACTICHGKDGVAAAKGYFPRIAGKPAGYLYNQLVHFREGRRNNATMAYLLENMTDVYLMEIAAYFAALDLPYSAPEPPTMDAGTLARGRVLVEQGDEARGVPACASCHGDALTGTLPSIPGLLGLRKEYLLAQFGGWRTGLRGASAPDCMRDISLRLSNPDLIAVANYLAQQAVPTPSKPLGGSRLPMPIECGSVPK